MVEALLEVLPELTARFEVVVVDDGSTDATIEVADELATYYPQVTALRHAMPRGRAAALRTGLGRSTGDVLLLFGPQCGPGLDEISRLWRAMEQYEVVLGCASLHPQSKPSAEKSPNAPAPAGFEMGWRRALEPVLDFVTDQAGLKAALSECGVSWHETAIGAPAERSSANHALGWLTGRSSRPAGQTGQAAKTSPPPGDPGRPKRPKYLDRAREYPATE
jgi:hypothetical protein